MTSDCVLRIINSYSYNMARLEEIKEQIESLTYKTTATYGNLAGGCGSGFKSKVEDLGNRRIELSNKANNFKHEINKVHYIIEKSGLNEREAAVMWWIANNGQLQAYARREHIGKNNIYKIRDRAIRKICTAHTPQYVG